MRTGGTQLFWPPGPLRTGGTQSFWPPGTLSTGGTQSFQAPGTLWTGGTQSFWPPGTLWTGGTPYFWPPKVPCGLAGLSPFSPPGTLYRLVGLSPFGHQVTLGLEDTAGYAYQAIYFERIICLIPWRLSTGGLVRAKREKRGVSFVLAFMCLFFLLKSNGISWI